MGDKMKQACSSFRDRKQETNHNSHFIFNEWVTITFVSCVPRGDKLYIPTYERGKKTLHLRIC